MTSSVLRRALYAFILLHSQFCPHLPFEVSHLLLHWQDFKVPLSLLSFYT